MSVDGIPIVVPDNTIVTLPATAVAWPELFKADGTPDMPGYPAVQWKATVSSASFWSPFRKPAWH